MSNKELLQDLQKQVAFLGSQLQRMKTKPDGISALDIDMLADKLKYLYAMIFELETGEALEEIPESKKVVVKQIDKPPVLDVKPEPEIPAPKAPEMKQDPVDSRQSAVGSEQEEDRGPRTEAQSPEPEGNTKHEERNTNNEVVEEPVGSLQSAVSSEENTEEKDPVSEKEQPATSNQELETNPTPNTQHPTPVTDPEPEAKTTADLFSGPTTIAEKFEAKEDTSIAARVTPQVVENLKMAIGINDKFLFINELFKGNPGEYNEAIDKLNAANALSLAETTMNEFSVRYEWSDQSEAYARLKKIVAAKFNGS